MIIDTENIDSKLFNDCRMETFYADERHVGSARCSVRLSDQYVWVEYEEEGTATYQGRASGPGHFTLVCAERKGAATLHIAPQSNILEGFWNEDGCRGMWRIHIDS